MVKALAEIGLSKSNALIAYPGVHEALGVLLENGVRVIGHTEARPLAVKDRAKRLNLEPYFDRIYCRERAEAHIGGDFGSTEAFTLVELSHHQQKPSPSVLREICEREDIDPSRALYVGDSLFKDVSMANAAGVDVAWAQYGTVSQQDLYPKLVAISHWRDEEIIRAKEFSRNKASARPDFVLDKSFFDILSCFGLHIEEGAGKLSRALSILW
ncbi:HAD-IA family hydrolase [Sphingosinicella sp. YJ22]|uniref:HAD family hydrolase n=1 Tax=Sphingosinicella sp. YJ22 TaxID=1104780 RepID=UPI001FAF30ED